MALSELTNREIEVLQLLTTGKRNKEIGSNMNVTERTIKFHVKNILKKLDASDRTHAVTVAIKRGIIEL